MGEPQDIPFQIERLLSRSHTFSFNSKKIESKRLKCAFRRIGSVLFQKFDVKSVLKQYLLATSKVPTPAADFLKCGATSNIANSARNQLFEPIVYRCFLQKFFLYVMTKLFHGATSLLAIFSPFKYGLEPSHDKNMKYFSVIEGSVMTWYF